MDQEEVAKMVARYDILAVPVVDDSHRLVGIVTVDDVIDIFRAEATEDILKMAGVGEEFIETKSIYKSTRMRLPWLFASCLGGIVAFYVINHFRNQFEPFCIPGRIHPRHHGHGGQYRHPVLHHRGPRACHGTLDACVIFARLYSRS